MASLVNIRAGRDGGWSALRIKRRPGGQGARVMACGLDGLHKISIALSYYSMTYSIAWPGDDYKMTSLDASIVIGIISLTFIILNFIKIHSPVIKIGNSYNNSDRLIGFVPVFENVTNNFIPKFTGRFLVLIDNALIGCNYDGSISPSGEFRGLHNVWRFVVNNGIDSDPITPEKRKRLAEKKPQLLIECSYHSMVLFDKIYFFKKNSLIKYVWDDVEGEWRFPRNDEWRMPKVLK
jgi:hypothetical protein